MAYKIIYETFWTDPGVKKLSLEARFLYLYLMTNPHAYYPGIYYLPESFIREGTGMSTQGNRKGFENLEGRVKYDRPNSVVWVVNMAKYQINQGNKANMIKGIANLLKDLPKSYLIGEYLEHYKEWRIPFTNPCPTHKEPMPESVAVEGEGKGKEEGKGELREEKPTDIKSLIERELREAEEKGDKGKVKEIAKRLDRMDKEERQLVKET